MAEGSGTTTLHGKIPTWEVKTPFTINSGVKGQFGSPEAFQALIRATSRFNLLSIPNFFMHSVTITRESDVMIRSSFEKDSNLYIEYKSV